jgi:osmotically-inducible protein OsmY
VNESTIEADIITELELDPRLPAPGEVAVEVGPSSVTLRGTVGSFAQRRAAVVDARRAGDGRDIFDELNVRPLDDWAREDAEIRGAALQRIMWDVELPSESIDVKVMDGWVTLKGDVAYQFQSDDAFDNVASLYGVLGITNEIRVTEET